MAGQENQQYTVLYGRLSQEDERAGESNSIQHQRTLLEKYAKEKGFENTIFLADDGYSGTNFERPSWKKIVEMIEAGQVANLIVKDASRLGREYLQVGLTSLHADGGASLRLTRAGRKYHDPPVLLWPYQACHSPTAALYESLGSCVLAYNAA